MNNIEKNQQLPLMGHIYSRATKVLIWLGPPTPEINAAFRYVDLYAAFLFIRRHSLFDGVGASVVKKIGELIIDKITREYLPINHQIRIQIRLHVFLNLRHAQVYNLSASQKLRHEQKRKMECPSVTAARARTHMALISARISMVFGDAKSLSVHSPFYEI
jgi:Heterokaryon incompatibility protein (HET)